MKTLEVKAGNVEEAIEKGLAELGVSREQIDYEVLDKGGIIKKAKVLISVKKTEGEKALAFLQEVFNKMNLNVESVLNEDDEKAEISITGEDSGTVIGYRGDVLDALQYVVSLAVNKDKDDFKKIVLDCENYRAKRSETLKSLAEKLANKAVRTGRKVSLEPMNPFERRIIHAALQTNEEVTTQSEGFDPNRFIVITPKNYVPQERPYGNRSSYGSRDRQSGSRPYGNRDGQSVSRDGQSSGRPYGSRDGQSGGRPYGNRDGQSGSRDGQSSGRPYSRDGQSRDGFKRDGGRSSSTKKSSSFSSFGTYLGNTKSGFSSDNDFTKKSGFDNLKD